MGKIILRYLVFSLGMLALAACGNKETPGAVDLDHTIEEKPGDVVFGEPDSPVTVFMYASYQCTYCRYFFSRTYPELKSNYLDKGKLKLVVKWLDFGERPQMLNALQAASCISRFGVYEKFHELLIVNPDVVFSGDFDLLLDDIMQHNEAIAECILNNDNYAYLKANVSGFRENKLTGTPTFVMNNRAYTGYYTYENFKKIIDKEFQF